MSASDSATIIGPEEDDGPRSGAIGCWQPPSVRSKTSQTRLENGVMDPVPRVQPKTRDTVGDSPFLEVG